MENLIAGISVLVFCTICLIYSWIFYKKNFFKAALFLLVLCGLVLRIYVASDHYLHDWDERYHALVAKNLIQHPLKPTLYDNPLLEYDYRNWSGNHIWLHKQPLPLWFIAFSLWLIGINEMAVRLPSIILST